MKVILHEWRAKKRHEAMRDELLTKTVLTHGRSGAFKNSLGYVLITDYFLEAR